MLNEVIAAFEAKAIDDRIGQLAFLFFSDREESARDHLDKHGFHVTRLEANAVIEIEQRWTSFNDYARSSPRPRQVIRERRAFEHSGISFHWIQKLDDAVIEKF